MSKYTPKSLREARQKRSLRQEDLAKIVGVTRPAVCNWENSQQIPSGSARILLAMTFNVPIEVVNSWFERAA